MQRGQALVVRGAHWRGAAVWRTALPGSSLELVGAGIPTACYGWRVPLFALGVVASPLGSLDRPAPVGRSLGKGSPGVSELAVVYPATRSF